MLASLAINNLKPRSLVDSVSIGPPIVLRVIAFFRNFARAYLYIAIYSTARNFSRRCFYIVAYSIIK